MRVACTAFRKWSRGGCGRETPAASASRTARPPGWAAARRDPRPARATARTAQPRATADAAQRRLAAGARRPAPGPARSPKLHSLLPMKLSGVAARIAIACASTFSTSADAHEQLQDDQVEAEREQADGQEARGLEAHVAVRGLERPVPVPEEVVRHRDAEREHRREDVVHARARAPASCRRPG